MQDTNLYLAGTIAISIKGGEFDLGFVSRSNTNLIANNLDDNGSREWIDEAEGMVINVDPSIGQLRLVGGLTIDVSNAEFLGDLLSLTETEVALGRHMIGAKADGQFEGEMFFASTIKIEREELLSSN